MRLSSFFIVFLVGNSALFGQTDRQALLKNPDIWWIGEINTVYQFELRSSWQKAISPDWARVGLEPPYFVKTIKTSEERFSLQDDEQEHELRRKLLTREWLENMELYKDRALTEPLQAIDAYRLVENIEVTELATEDQQHRIGTRYAYFAPKRIEFYLVRQLAYFDRKELAFKLLPEAIAPLAAPPADDSTARFEPLFWIKIEAASPKVDAQHKQIVWAKRTFHRINLLQAEVVKQTKTLGAVGDYFVAAVPALAEQKRLFNPSFLDLPLTYADIKLHMEGNGTLSYRDGDGNRVKKQVSKRFSGQTISKMQIGQEWFLDTQRKRLLVRNAGFLPLVQSVDAAGEVVQEDPLFYKR